MTRFHLASLVCVRKLNPARRLTALKRMRRRLDGLPPAEAAPIRARIEEAIAQQRAALAMNQSRRTSNEAVMHADGAKGLDRKLDKLLSMFNDTLGGFVELFGGEKAALARKVREAVFRDGVAPITRRPFVEQHELLVLLVHDLREGDLGAAIAALKLEEWVDRLDELNVEYGQQITRPERVHADAVRAAELRAFVAFLEVVTGVLSLHSTDAEADLAGRERLLQPIAEQEQEAALLRARRRGAERSHDGGEGAFEDEEDEEDGEDSEGDDEALAEGEAALAG